MEYGKVLNEARFTRLSGIPSSQWLESGRQMSTSVSAAYASPFKFNGELREVRLQFQ